MKPPARHPAKRRASSCTTGILPQVQEDSEILQFEGRLDLDFQIIMAVAPHVLSYRAQPETFRWFDGRQFRYTPDGLAHTAVGNLYFEVKPERMLARSPDLGGRIARIRTECANRGAGFCVVTETQIGAGSLLSNSKAIWSASQGADPADVRRACRALCSLAFPTTKRAVCAVLGAGNWTLVKALIGQRYLAADLLKPLGDDVVLTRGLRDW